MKEFYRNKYLMLAQLLFAGWPLFIFVYALILTGDPFMIGLSIIVVCPIIYFYALNFSRPAVIIENNKIIVRGFFNKVWKIDELNKYKLVISLDFIAFRHGNDNDIMVDRWFTKKQWTQLISELKLMEFNGIIE